MPIKRTSIARKLHVGIVIAIGWLVVGGCSRSANSAVRQRRRVLTDFIDPCQSRFDCTTARQD